MTNPGTQFWAVLMASILVAVWVIISTLLQHNRGFIAFKRWFRCHLFHDHAPGPFKPAVGGKNIQRCLYCDKVVAEHRVSKESITRIR